MHTWGSDQNLWGYRTTGNPHDIEELKEPVHTHELRLPANEDIRGFLQFSGDLIEAEAHIDDTRNQRDGEDSINEKILLPRQKARRINGENPDEDGTDELEALGLRGSEGGCTIDPSGRDASRSKLEGIN